MKQRTLLLIILLPALWLLPVALARAEGPPSAVQVLRSDPSGLTLRLRPNDIALQPDQVEGEACQRVVGREGARDILPLLLGAPPNARVTASLRPLSTRRLSLTTPLCSELEANPALATAGNARVVEMGMMRSQRLVRVEAPLAWRDAAGRVLLLTDAMVDVRFDGGDPGAITQEPESFEALLRETLLNYAQARRFRQTPPASARVQAWTPPAPAWRVLVNEPGLYELTYQDLQAAGLPVDSLDPRTLRLFNFGKEVAITVTGEEDSRLDSTDRLLFFGRGVDTRYTDVNVYWLTFGHGQGLRMAEHSSSVGAAQLDYTTHILHSEENSHYVPSLPMAEGHDHWFGGLITVSGHDNSAHRDIPFSVKDPAAGAHTATLTLQLGGNMNAVHHLRVYVNDVLIHDDSWHGRTLYSTSIAFSQQNLQAGTNAVRLEFVNDASDQRIDQVYVDWLELAYARRLATDEDYLEFAKEDPAPRTFQIEGFSSPQLELYDITTPETTARIVGWRAVATGDGHYRLEFGETHAGGQRYWAQTTAQRKKPLAIQPKASMARPLASPENGADYLVIYHPDFRTAIEPLLAHRSAQGYRVMAVSTQEVYDEFGYGMMSAEAIRDFLAYAYDHWQRPAPSYVLLVGDGTYDPRHYLSSSGDTYLPPFLAMVDPTLGETAADNRFVAVAGDDILPDMHVGRLPANSPAETTAMVNKILTYERTSAAAPWTKRILFVTDNLDGGGGNFYELSDAIADGYIDPPANTTLLIPGDYQRTKLYLGRTCVSGADCRQKMTQELNNQGAMFVSYIGHGTKTFWAREKIWDVTAASQLQNGEKLPIMLPMTCNEGYFHEAARTAQSTSEAAVRLPNHGAVASWAPTGYGLSLGHDYLERGFFLSVFHGSGQRIGPATTAGKLYLIANAPSGTYIDLIDTFLLMGDPALQLPLAEASSPQQLYLPIVVKE